MKRHYLIALILLGSLSVFAQTGNIRGTKDDVSVIADSGNEFLLVCGNESMLPMVHGYCYGYVFGVMDMFLSADPTYRTLICKPDEVALGQQYNIVLKFIRDHPKEAREQTAVLIPLAITEAFPCPKK